MAEASGRVMSEEALRKIENQYRESLEHARKMQSMIGVVATQEEAELYRQQFNFEMLKAEGYRKQLRAVQRQLKKKSPLNDPTGHLRGDAG